MKAFLAGLGTGIAVGVWFAPRSGEETRRQLRDRVEHLGGTLQQRADELRDRTEDFRRRVTETAQNAASEVKQAADNIENVVLDRLNSGSRDQLLGIYGIGPITADKIIAARPFTSAREIVDRGIVPNVIFQDLLREFKVA
jgi:gas vesicle protein